MCSKDGNKGGLLNSKVPFYKTKKMSFKMQNLNALNVMIFDISFQLTGKPIECIYTRVCCSQSWQLITSNLWE